MGEQGGWEQRIEAFVKIQKNFFFFFFFGGGGGVGSGGGVGLGGQGGCERRSKISKKKLWGGDGSGWGGRGVQIFSIENFDPWLSIVSSSGVTSQVCSDVTARR